MKLQFKSVAVFTVLVLVTFFGTVNATDVNLLDVAIAVSKNATIAG